VAQDVSYDASFAIDVMSENVHWASRRIEIWGRVPF
jgi:hypothetical protein